MIVLIKKIFRFLYHILIKLRLTIKLIIHPSIIKGESYYPEYSNKGKNTWRIWLDQLKHIWRYCTIEDFYYLFGFDIKRLTQQNQYVDNTYFKYRRSQLNGDILHAPVAVLRDKYLFSLVAEAADIPIPQTLGLIEDGVVTRKGKEKISIIGFIKSLENVDVFIKSIDGECGDGVFHVKSDGDSVMIGGVIVTEESLIKQFSNGRYLIQEKITQHEKINALFSHSINTIRLVTVYNNKEKQIEVFSVGLRIGTGSNDVDNWAMGGLFVGIEKETGKLKKYGYYKPGFGTKTTRHPDTAFLFEGYQIPFYKEAVNTAIRFHTVLKGMHSIGWDIAICENGPCFIEGNDNWEISLMQVVDGGLKKDFDKLF